MDKNNLLFVVSLILIVFLSFSSVDATMDNSIDNINYQYSLNDNSFSSNEQNININSYNSSTIYLNDGADVDVNSVSDSNNDINQDLVESKSSNQSDLSQSNISVNNINQSNFIDSQNDGDNSLGIGHKIVTVSNWSDFKKYAEDDSAIYTIYLENTTFVPDSQIVVNNTKITIIGKEGMIIGSSNGLNSTPLLINYSRALIQNLNFAYVLPFTNNAPNLIKIFGNATISNCSFYHIGGVSIYIEDGHVNVSNCNFTNCTTAIVVYGDANVGPYYSYMNVYNSNFINGSRAVTAGAILNSGQLFIVNCSFIHNVATYWGGALVSNPTTNITVYNSTFEDNVAGWNGGVVSSYSWLQMYNCICKGNNCTTSYGGGALFGLSYGGSDANFTIVNCTFEDNANNCDPDTFDFPGRGGAISLGDYGVLKVLNCTFIKNLASTGLAISAVGYEGYGNPTVAIAGNTFINHTGEDETIFLHNLSGSAIKENNTFINSNVHYYLNATKTTINLGSSTGINIYLANASYYDDDLLNKTNFTLYIVDPEGSVDSVNLVDGNIDYLFTPKNEGNYTFYANTSSFSNATKNLTINVIVPTDPVINDITYSNYFNDDGTLIDEGLIVNSIIYIDSITNKNIIINNKLNILPYEDNGIITNGTITLNEGSSGSIIDGLTFDYIRDNRNNVNLISIQSGVKDVVVSNNNLSIVFNSSTRSSAGRGIQINSNDSSNISLLDNIIDISGNVQYVYGIEVNAIGDSTIGDLIIVGNNISLNGPNIVKGFNISGVVDSVISNNSIIAISTGNDSGANAYGVDASKVNNLSFNDNVVDVSAVGDSFGFNIYDGANLNLDSNDVVVNGTGAIGVGISGDDTYVNITNNRINTTSDLSIYDSNNSDAENIPIKVVNGANANIEYNFLITNDSAFLIDGAGNSTNVGMNFISFGGAGNPIDTVIGSAVKKTTALVFSNMTTTAIYTARTGEYFVANLTDGDGKALANKTVQIGFNGATYNRTTDENGSFRLQVNLKIAGGYTFAICFLGDDEYNGTFGVAKITVKKATTKLTNVKSKYAYKSSAKTKSIAATLKLSNGTVVSGKTVKFTVNGKAYSATTNSKGVATVKISITAKKTYSYTVKFAATTQLAASSTTGKLVIS